MMLGPSHRVDRVMTCGRRKGLALGENGPLLAKTLVNRD